MGFQNEASFQENITGYQGQAFFIRIEEKNIDLYRYIINGLSFGEVLSNHLDTKPINKLCGVFFRCCCFCVVFFFLLVVTISNWFRICSISTIFQSFRLSCIRYNVIFGVYLLPADAAFRFIVQGELCTSLRANCTLFFFPSSR